MTLNFTPEVQVEISRFENALVQGEVQVAADALKAAQDSASTSEERAEVLREAWKRCAPSGLWRQVRTAAQAEVSGEIQHIAAVYDASGLVRQVLENVVAEMSATSSEVPSLEDTLAVLRSEKPSLEKSIQELIKALRALPPGEEEQLVAQQNLLLAHLLVSPFEGGSAITRVVDYFSLVLSNGAPSGPEDYAKLVAATLIGLPAKARLPGVVWHWTTYFQETRVKKVGPERRLLLLSLLILRSGSIEREANSRVRSAWNSLQGHLTDGIRLANGVLGDSEGFTGTRFEPPPPDSSAWDGGFKPVHLVEILQMMHREGAR
jgi:hypothetical protein